MCLATQLQCLNIQLPWIYLIITHTSSNTIWSSYLVVFYFHISTYILKRIWHDLSVTVDIMSLQFGHDVLQHFLPTMDRFSQKEKQVLLRHNCERHKSSISYSRQRRGRCWQTSIFFVFFEIWLCDVLERPTVQENRCCWYFVVQAPMDKSSVT